MTKKAVKKVAKKVARKAKRGRPSAYDPKFVEEAYKYLERCQDIEDEYHKTRGEKSDTYERVLTVKLPTHEGLALFLNASVKTLYTWAETHEDFLQALDDIKTAQKERLIEKGLSGDYNSTIAKLILSSNHDMREKSDTNLSNPDGNLKTIIINKYGSGNQPAT